LRLATQCGDDATAGPTTIKEQGVRIEQLTTEVGLESRLWPAACRMAPVRRNRPFAGRGKPSGLADSGYSLIVSINTCSGRVDHGMIRLEGRPRRGPQMSATPDSTLANPEQRIADLERQLAEREVELAECRAERDEYKAERDEALEQQTATAEVLQVINSTPGDLTPVFDAMLEKATRLCEASFGILWNFTGDLAVAGALHRVPEAYAELCRAPFHPSPGSGPARMMRGENGFALADVAEYSPYLSGDELTRAIVDLAGARSVMIEPLRKDGVTLGAITLYR
jgi:hypothetical protein